MVYKSRDSVDPDELLANAQSLLARMTGEQTGPEVDDPAERITFEIFLLKQDFYRYKGQSFKRRMHAVFSPGRLQNSCFYTLTFFMVAWVAFGFWGMVIGVFIFIFLGAVVLNMVKKQNIKHVKRIISELNPAKRQGSGSGYTKDPRA